MESKAAGVAAAVGSAPARRGALWQNGLTLVSFAAMAFALYMIFMYAPKEKEMGQVQRIFYLMMPLAWVGFLSFFVVLVGSIAYLWKRSFWWDIVAQSAAEIGLLCISLVLIIGMLWARPTWGVWWEWEPRLTAALVLWFTYLGYHLVRAYAGERHRAARFGAVVGIVGFVDVPITALATTLWRTNHPAAIVFKGDVDSAMVRALIVSFVAFTILYITLMLSRVALGQAQEDVEELKERVAEE